MHQEDEFTNQHPVFHYFIEVVKAYYNCYGNCDEAFKEALETLKERAKTQFNWQIETMRDGEDIILRVWDPSTASTVISTTLNVYIGDGEVDNESNLNRSTK